MPVAALLIASALGSAAADRLIASGASETPAQENRSRKFGPGECGRADPTYVRLANETGGQPFFLNPSEAGKAFHFVRETSGGDETFLWAMGTLDAGAFQEFSVPVDSTTRRVTFALSVGASGSDLAVVDPAGDVVAVADYRTEITVLNCGRIVTVDAPAAGLWRLRVSGVGPFWLTAHGRSALSFVTAEFVQRGGRPAHEGLFRIAGQPVAGARATLRAMLSREGAKTTAFDLVSQHGDAIQAARLTPDPSEGDDASGEFIATFELPSQPFRVRARGLDEAGNRYQRMFHTLFHAETVEVAPAGALDDLVPGTSTEVTFSVRNVGPAASFRIVAADGRRFVSRFEPRTLRLETGAAALVSVWITVPADTPSGTGVDVTVTAQSESAPATTNGATMHLSIFAKPQ